MRVVIIFLLLMIFGFIAWKAFERFRPVETLTPAPAEDVADPDAGADAGEETAEAALPRFDIVYVTRSGYATIAGRAAPRAKVTVFANDEELASTDAIGDGSWTLATETPLDAGPVELSLEMTTVDGLTVRSEETILIYVPEREGDRPLVLRTTPGGATEVLQDPRDPDTGVGPLTLDAIDYDDSGSVIFSGRAEPNRVVQVFANRNPVNQTTSSDGGRWSMTATMAPGIYTLLIVQLDANGQPAYAIELPFERATADQIDLRDGKVIVQPGNSLWRIARRAYGSGFQYTVIYEANADQIRDPDLIYPGQIFSVPGGSDDDQ
ncbi:MAG: LysM peptidoglycan-binding domain-containing protein [Pseudomonadota bacterium]